jgi:hypothetical protein
MSTHFKKKKKVKCHNQKAKFFFDKSTQEEGGGFELVTFALLGVVPAD